MTHVERVSTLRNWGYTERQAEFLVFAALSGGFFLHRQARRFLNSTDQADSLVRQLTGRRHVTITHLLRGHHLYQVTYAPMYEALGEENNRNRRRRNPYGVKARVMALDYVLGHSAVPLLTAAEKVAYFCQTTGIDAECLPSQKYLGIAHYFPHKFPVPVVSNGPCFSYIDAGAQTLSGFDSWMAMHTKLFASLISYEVHYVCTRADLSTLVQHRFQRSILSINSSGMDMEARELSEYFRLRDVLDRARSRTLGIDDLQRLRELRGCHSDIETERLYEQWQQRGDAVFLTTNITEPRFRCVVLEGNYAAFGRLFDNRTAARVQKNQPRSSPSSPDQRSGGEVEIELA